MIQILPSCQMSMTTESVFILHRHLLLEDGHDEMEIVVALAAEMEMVVAEAAEALQLHRQTILTLIRLAGVVVVRPCLRTECAIYLTAHSHFEGQRGINIKSIRILLKNGCTPNSERFHRGSSLDLR